MKPRAHSLTLSVVSALGLAVASTSTAAANPVREGDRHAGDHQRTSQDRAVASRHSGMHEISGDVRMSNVVGMGVEYPNGERLGEVEDLIVDTREGKIAYAVLSLGGFLDIGNRLVSVPLSKLRPGSEGDRLVLTQDARALRSFESFERDRWPDLNSPARARERLEDRGATLDRYRRASNLLGTELRDRSGERVGHFEDVVMNFSSGKLRYAVAEFDPSWFDYGKLVVLPVTNIHARDRDREDLVMVVDRSKLRYAPAFSRAQWPDLNERGFRGRTDRYLSQR